MKRNLEDSVLDRLYEATARGILQWVTDSEDANREVWRSEIGGEPLQVELIYVQSARSASSERFAIEVSAFGHRFTASFGSERYDTVMDMLSFSMFGWREARAANEKKLKSAVAKLDSLLKKGEEGAQT